MRGRISLTIAFFLWISGLVVVPAKYGVEKPFSLYCMLALMVGSLFTAYGIDGVFSGRPWANKAFMFCLGMIPAFGVSLFWFLFN